MTVPWDIVRRLGRARLQFDADGHLFVAIQGVGDPFPWEGENRVRGLLRECFDLDRAQARQAAALLAEVVADENRWPSQVELEASDDELPRKRARRPDPASLSEELEEQED